MPAAVLRSGRAMTTVLIELRVYLENYESSIWITCYSRRDQEVVVRSFRTLSRYWRLLAHYLRPLGLRMGLLAVILCGTIAVQVATPLVASRFIDQAASGGALADLILLALLTMGLA